MTTGVIDAARPWPDHARMLKIAFTGTFAGKRGRPRGRHRRVRRRRGTRESEDLLARADHARVIAENIHRIARGEPPVHLVARPE
jgi:hypothetical protein